MKTLVLLLALSATSMFAIDLDGRDGEPSPVPEPATVALMGAGLAAVGFAAWRKNRK